MKMRLPLLLLSAVLAFEGCDSSTTSTVGQSVDEAAWLPDGSGLIAFIRKTTYSAVDNSQYTSSNVYRIGTDGSIGSAIVPTDQQLPAFYASALLLLSPDGKTAITQFGVHIFRVNLGSGDASNIIQNTYLYGGSPDLRYAVTEANGRNFTNKLVTLYDLSANPIRGLFPAQTRPGVVGTRALWIDSGRFALTLFDSMASNGEYDHVTIYDTSGNIVQSIPDADVALHASAFSPRSRDLFVRTHSAGIDRINLSTGVRTKVVSQDTVYSADVSLDGTLLVYISDAPSKYSQLPAYAVNVNNGHIDSLGAGFYFPCISPHADRVAFVRQLDMSGNQDMTVMPVSLPQ